MASPRTIRVWLLLGIALGAIGIFLLILKRPDPGSASRDPQPANQRTEPADRKDARTAGTDEPAGSTADDEAKVSALIRDSAEAFRTNRDPSQASALLLALRDGIRQAPEEAAAAAIVGFLKKTGDAPTGLPFAVGPDGMMAAVPSLRLALLDLLPSLDPQAALEVARAIMDQRTTADEYALALRNMAWNDLDGDLKSELSGRFMDLLKMPWLEKPSAGFLEAFDIAVEVGGAPMFDRMVALAGEAMAKGNTAASRAAFMSMDRMIVRNPAVLGSAFSKDAEWMAFAPQQRASLMSRLDITQPDQREIFNRYLSSPKHAAGELEYFAKVFPNQNYLYGHRLVTTDDTTPTIAEVAAADARVVAELDALEGAATSEGGAAIRTIRERLKKPAK
ncbi:MAG: hypothetical protein V4819_02945 [Verrucomicrobiota bacterium]